ncbi:hypothetical protein V5O48_014674, partial [Marasmius crinis-equi]
RSDNGFAPLRATDILDELYNMIDKLTDASDTVAIAGVVHFCDYQPPDYGLISGILTQVEWILDTAVSTVSDLVITVQPPLWGEPDTSEERPTVQNRGKKVSEDQAGGKGNGNVGQGGYPRAQSDLLTDILQVPPSQA